MPRKEKVIYLTFDDGPVPGPTDFVLEELARHNAKATFFCVGDNIRKNPDVFKKVLEMGHQVGNHTYNHLNGWKTSFQAYIDNVKKCQEEMHQHGISSNLFRPPYGAIKFGQLRFLKKKHRVVMWSLLTNDFNSKVSPEDCLRKSIRYTHNGAVVIFHDSYKTLQTLQFVLPKYLAHFSSLGYRFELL